MIREFEEKDSTGDGQHKGRFSVLTEATYLNITCLDIDDSKKLRMTDEQAKILIERVSGCSNIGEFQDTYVADWYEVWISKTVLGDVG